MLFDDKNLNEYKNEINIHFIILKSNSWICPSNIYLILRPKKYS